MRNQLTCLVVASPRCSTVWAPSFGSRPHHSQALRSCSQLTSNLLSRPRSLLVCLTRGLLEELDDSGVGLKALPLSFSKQVAASTKPPKLREFVVEHIHERGARIIEEHRDLWSGRPAVVGLIAPVRRASAPAW